jgi:hypothetical protein
VGIIFESSCIGPTGAAVEVMIALILTGWVWGVTFQLTVLNHPNGRVTEINQLSNNRNPDELKEKNTILNTPSLNPQELITQLTDYQKSW